MARSPFGIGTATPNSNPSVTYKGGGMAAGPRPGKHLAVGQEMYLWLLVFTEVALMAALRMQFRNRHGG